MGIYLVNLVYETSCFLVHESLGKWGFILVGNKENNGTITNLYG
jgi:hypothetical protein